VMRALILAMVLTAQPNLFEPKEFSSEAIFAAVATCMDRAMDSGMSSVAAVPMCGCLTDAVRLNAKKGVKPTDPTLEQQARCHAESAGQQPKKKPGKTGT